MRITVISPGVRFPQRWEVENGESFLDRNGNVEIQNRVLNFEALANYYSLYHKKGLVSEENGPWLRPTTTGKRDVVLF